jgi:hypothetical protein
MQSVPLNWTACDVCLSQAVPLNWTACNLCFSQAVFDWPPVMLFYIIGGAPQAVPGTACVVANQTACTEVCCSSVTGSRFYLDWTHIYSVFDKYETNLICISISGWWTHIHLNLEDSGYPVEDTKGNTEEDNPTLIWTCSLLFCAALLSHRGSEI